MPALPTLPHDDRPAQSLWRVVDDRLRGRWRWMMLLAVVLAGGLGVAGWRSAAPVYESVGVIRVTPRVPVTLEEMPEAEVAKFSMFVNTQVQLIRSRRVLENAMESPQIESLPWSEEPDALEQLAEELRVEPGRDSELIYVSFEASEPRRAQAIVNAVIASYDDIYGQAGGIEIGRTLERLRGAEAQFQRQLNQVRGDLTRVRRRHGSTDLTLLHASKLEELARVKDLMESIRAAIESGEAEPTMPAPDDPAASALLLERMEAVEPRLAGLRRERDSARSELDLVKARYRPSTAAYRSAETRFRVADKVLHDALLETLEQWQAVPGGVTGGLEASDLAGISPGRLEEKLETLKRRQAELEKQGRDLIADLPVVTDLRAAEQRLLDDLGRTRRRIQGLALEEQNIAGRIVIEQEGFRPTTPSDDARPKRLVMAAGMGCSFSFGLFFLLGTLDRRAYGTEQLGGETGELPTLGVLPDLGRDGGDRESSEVASHCVHQIRNQIEAVRAPGAGRGSGSGFVLTITSPFQGDGKTSIVLALGWSYAVAGFRTLLVDCDLVGRSLTRQLGMVGRAGLREALLDGRVSGLITSLDVDKLDALAVGADARCGPESVRKIDLIALLDQLRDRYDVIILDTGPVLGSLESTPVTAAADGVVLSVRRGRSRTRLEETQQRLHAVGATCLGVILNWAARSDCHRYVSEPSRATGGAGQSQDRPVSIMRGGDRSALVTAMERAARGEES